MKNKDDFYNLHNLLNFECEICFSYPLSISEDVYEDLSKEEHELGWVFNYLSKCYTHHFLTKEERDTFIEKLKDKLRCKDNDR